MTTDELREKYGKQVHFNCKDDDEAFTDEYVLWLENMLLERYDLKSKVRIERAIRFYDGERTSYLSEAINSNNGEDRERNIKQVNILDARIEELKWVIENLNNIY